MIRLHTQLMEIITRKNKFSMYRVQVCIKIITLIAFREGRTGFYTYRFWIMSCLIVQFCSEEYEIFLFSPG